MKIILENYHNNYNQVHDFLVNSKCTSYTYARFDWMLTNFEYLEVENLPKIGLWKKKDKIVAATLFDHTLDSVFLVTLKHYKRLYKKMFKYAIKNMSIKGMENFSVYVENNDKRLQKTCKNLGFLQSDWTETVLKFDLKDKVNVPDLGNDLSYISLRDCDGFKEYDICLFKGFDHEKEKEYSYDLFRQSQFDLHYKKNYVDLSLKVSIINEKKEHVAHCGIWFDSNSDFAVIEPVCVIPEYRNQKLGTAVVLEGLKRAQRRGAKFAIVGSDMEFYKKIGFIEFNKGSYWIKKNNE